MGVHCSFRMRFTATILLTIVSACAAMAGLHKQSHPVVKKWYGVQKYEKDKETQGGNAVYTWPVRKEVPYHQPIYYCFKDERSAKNLKLFVAGAIALWGPAIKVSALSIEPAPPAAHEQHVFCDDKRMADYRDALVISDETKDEDDAWNDSENCNTITTQGYMYTPVGSSLDVAYRHFLKFCKTRDMSQATAIRNFAHEIGHSIGLAHEHQRPDRDRYLWFKCKHLRNYEEAEKLVRLDEQELFDPSLSQEERMKLCCDDYDIALEYFPIAVDFIPYNHKTIDPTLEAMWASFEHSPEFDYESIMIYDSDSGGKMDSSGTRQRTVLSRKPGNEKVWMGGNENPAKAMVSKGDIARVQMLYSPAVGSGEADASRPNKFRT